MNRSWRSVGIWGVALVAAPVVLAGILALIGWPIANDRILLALVFAAELFLILVPASWLHQEQDPPALESGVPSGSQLTMSSRWRPT
jgi:hypothetical protein